LRINSLQKQKFGVTLVFVRCNDTCIESLDFLLLRCIGEHILQRCLIAPSQQETALRKKYGMTFVRFIAIKTKNLITRWCIRIKTMLKNSF